MSLHENAAPGGFGTFRRDQGQSEAAFERLRKRVYSTDGSAAGTQTLRTAFHRGEGITSRGGGGLCQRRKKRSEATSEVISENAWDCMLEDRIPGTKGDYDLPCQ